MYKDQNVVMKFSKSVHSFGNNSQATVYSWTCICVYSLFINFHVNLILFLCEEIFLLVNICVSSGSFNLFSMEI